MENLGFEFMANTIEKDCDDYIEEMPLGRKSSGDDASEAVRHFQLDWSQSADRLDKVLASLMTDVSRARIQDWIRLGAVSVNGQVETEVRSKVAGGDKLDVTPQALPEDQAYRPESDVDFRVLYEDETLLVIDKPAGLVVHPAAGHWSGTLLNGLLYRYPELSRVPRAGIVHRLDRETSGLMVVARTEAAQTDLVRQLQARTVCREYWALVLGVAPPMGFVDSPIGRDPRNPIKFACNGIAAKPAKTHVRLMGTVYPASRAVSWVVCRLDTGRTHQIRVHLTSVGLPLLGDPLYRTNASKMPDAAGLAARFNRQALHASRLRLIHPATRQSVEWFARPPEDMRTLMQSLGFGPTDEPVHVFD